MALGGVAWVAVIGFYALGLITRGRGDLFTALAYNAPIALLFLVLGALTARAWLLGFPRWFTAFGAASTVVAVILKFAEFRGPSGVPGILVGMTLTMALLLVERRRDSRAKTATRFRPSCVAAQSRTRARARETRSGTTSTRNGFAPPS